MGNPLGAAPSGPPPIDPNVVWTVGGEAGPNTAGRLAVASWSATAPISRALNPLISSAEPGQFQAYDRQSGHQPEAVSHRLAAIHRACLADRCRSSLAKPHQPSPTPASALMAQVPAGAAMRRWRPSGETTSHRFPTNILAVQLLRKS